jgi:hypothetical protein
VIALGLFAFTLQFVAQGLKYLAGQIMPGVPDVDPTPKSAQS